MPKAHSYRVWSNHLATKAVCLSFFTFGCIRSPDNLVFEREQSRAKVSSVTVSPPPILQSKIQSGLIDAVSIQISPGKCADGSEGTKVEKTIRKVSDQALIADIRLKSNCDYKIFIEIGKMDPTSQFLSQVFLTNVDNPTSLQGQDVAGEIVKTRAKLTLTPEGQSLLGSSTNTIPLEPTLQPVAPQPVVPAPVTPQPSPQISPDAIQLGSIAFTLPEGYKLAQVAKDGDVRMAIASRDSIKVTLFSRPRDCTLKSFLASGAQMDKAETVYQSRGGINWNSATTKFRSKYTGKTVSSGIFSFLTSSGRCAFGYVTSDSADKAESEMKTVMDAITLSQ